MTKTKSKQKMTLKDVEAICEEIRTSDFYKKFVRRMLGLAEVHSGFSLFRFGGGQLIYSWKGSKWQRVVIPVSENFSVA